MRTAFETGAFDMYEKSDFDQFSSLQTAQRENPSTQMEHGLLSIFAEVLEAWQSEIGINTSLFGLGVSSVEMRLVTSTINKTIKPQQAVIIAYVMLNPKICKP